MEEEGKVEAAPAVPKKQRAWGLETYNKWDGFEDNDDDADADDADAASHDADQGQGQGQAPTASATQFDMGCDKLVIEERNMLSAVVSSPAERKRLKALRQDKNEVWQVVVRKLRVWTAETGTGDESGPAAGGGKKNAEELVPCRPHSVIISSLYPDGKLVSQQLCHPPEAYPSAERILEFVAEACMQPLFGEQRRPNVLTFSDAKLAGALFRSFESLSVEVSELSESEGIDEVVGKFSGLLVKKDIASVGPTSDRPGLLSVAGVSVPLLRPVFAAVRAFAAKEPWREVVERRAFQLTAVDAVELVSAGKKLVVEPGTAWVCVFGNDSLRAARGRPQACGKGTYGIAVFFSKLDLEARLLPKGETLYVPEAGAGAEEERCSYSGVTAAELGRDLKRTKPPRVDVRTGKELLFADGDALRKHWPAVRKFAIAKADVERGRAERRQHWADAECTLLFEDVTVLPFDDLDLFDAEPDALGPVPEGSAPSLGSARHPLLLQFRKGAPERPSPEQLLWLHRAMRATLCLLEQDHIGKDKHEPATVCVEAHLLQGQAHQETLKVEPTPIFFASEAQAAAKTKRAAQEAGSKEAESQKAESQEAAKEGDNEEEEEEEEEEEAEFSPAQSVEPKTRKQTDDQGKPCTIA